MSDTELEAFYRWASTASLEEWDYAPAMRAWQAARALSEQDRRDADAYRTIMLHDLTAEYSDLWFAKLNYNGDELSGAVDRWHIAIDAAQRGEGGG